jgi:hypothetical protein
MKYLQDLVPGCSKVIPSCSTWNYKVETSKLGNHFTLHSQKIHAIKFFFGLLLGI